MSPPWLCAQIGAREHYSVARALHLSGALDTLFTDAWVRPGSLYGATHRPLAERFHRELATATVSAWNAGLLAFEIAARVNGLSGWPLTMKRNLWFQRKLVQAFSSFCKPKTGHPVLFAYSYAALEPLRFARKQGWRTVLGQIDPGPAEERLVTQLHRKNGSVGSRWVPAPEEYWQMWREECALADRIVVNSLWSRTALVEEEIDAQKIAVIPLAFEAPQASVNFQRNYPGIFTEKRPLRVLFLGQVNLRKGIAEVLEAIRLLQDNPIEFSIVGPTQIEIPSDLQVHPKVHWIGPVPRSSATDYYRWADVFLFPTHSDGFGLTQLEAQAWKLPIIASRFCGDVVEDGRNGWLLQEVSAEAISEQVLGCLHHPKSLAKAATESGIAPEYTLSAVGASLFRLGSNQLIY